MSETKSTLTSRREFLKNTGRIAAASALAASRPARPRGREQHDPGGPDRLRRPGHRRGGQRPVRQERPDQAGGHGRRLRGPAQRAATTNLQEAVRRPGRRARGPQVPRLRRLPEGDGLPEAGRRGDLRHARRPSAGSTSPTPSRRASTSSWRSRSRWTARPRARCSQLAEEADEEEPQGGRGPDGPPLPGPAGTATTASSDGEIGDIIAAAGLSHGRPAAAPPAPSRTTSASCSTRSSGSTLPLGQRRRASATSTSTRSTSAAG